jgi:CRISP-associated protein Cas1
MENQVEQTQSMPRKSGKPAYPTLGETGLPLRTVYLCDPNIHVCARSFRLEFRCKKQGLIGKLPLLQIRQLIVMAHVGISRGVMDACLLSQIPVTLLSERGELLGHLLGARTHDVQTRVAQYKAFLSEDVRLTVARKTVQSKLRQSAQLLRQYAYNHQAGSEGLRRAAGKAMLYAENAQKAQGLDELRGWEGAAAKEYFAVFGQMLRDPFSFTVRTRRPPLDPVNALLSFGYTLLVQEAAAILEAVGLDSYLGFLHAPAPGRPSLALDMIEPLRSKVVDRLAISGINLGIFTPDDFETHRGSDGAVLLNAEGRKKYFARYEFTMANCTEEYAVDNGQIGAPRKLVEQECENLKRAILEGNARDWTPRETPFASEWPRNLKV